MFLYAVEYLVDIALCYTSIGPASRSMTNSSGDHYRTVVRLIEFHAVAEISQRLPCLVIGRLDQVNAL